MTTSLSSNRTFQSEYSLAKRLAAGAFGTTYTAVEKASGRQVVVKQPHDASDVTDFDKVVAKQSPYIVRVFEIFSDDRETFVVMEFCAGGNLFNAVWTLYKKEGYVDKTWCAKIFRQVLQGLHYIQEQFKESHNDIKPENILLERPPEGSADAPRTMLADFGCASGRWERAVRGDPRYLAPEIWSSTYDYDGLTGVAPVASDAWSSGVTLFEILSGLLPFINHPNVSGWQNFCEAKNGKLLERFQKKQQQIASGQVLEADCSIIKDPKAQDLLRRCLQVRIEKRITIKEALNHQWILQAQRKGAPKVEDRLDNSAVLAHAKVASENELRGVLLLMISSQLQGTHIDYYQKIWEKYDTNNDGVLNLTEFKKMNRELRVEQKGIKTSESQAQELFNTIDVDRSGTIDFNEFVAFMFDPSRLQKDVFRMYFASAFSHLKSPNNMVKKSDFFALFGEHDRNAVNALFEEIQHDARGDIQWHALEAYVQRLCSY